MFNFTTQTIYNSIVTTAGDPKRNLWAVSGKTPALRIGNTRFDADNILDVLVKRPTVGNITYVRMNLQSLADTGQAEYNVNSENAISTEITGRIVLYIGLSMNCQDSFYANNYVYKGKPLYIEFPMRKGDTSLDIANRIKHITDKYLLMVMGEKILNVSTYYIEGTADPVTGEKPKYYGVRFDGVNCYQLIKKAELLWFNPKAKELDCCTNSGDYETIKSGKPIIYITSLNDSSFGLISVKDYYMNSDGEYLAKNNDTDLLIFPGIEPFGDYDWMIHNLRLPTLANTNFWSPTKLMGELPEVGSTYTQFIVRLCAEREGISGEIVGAKAKSVTTHVLYVKTDYAKTVLDAFAALSNDIEIKYDADNQLYNPYNLDPKTGVNDTNPLHVDDSDPSIKNAILNPTTNPEITLDNNSLIDPPQLNTPSVGG